MKCTVLNSDRIKALKNYLQEIKKPVEVFSADISFSFVNRKEEVIQTIFLFVKNLWSHVDSPGTWTLLTTVVADQMFGSGKTYFGRHLISAAKMHETEIKERLNLHKTLVSEEKHEKYSKFVDEIYRRILDCSYAHISFRIPAEYIISWIDDRLDTKSDIFFHIDELKSDVKEIRIVWEYLVACQKRMILENNRIVVFYFSGKNTPMNKFRSQNDLLPTCVHWLLLPSFKEEHVRHLYAECFYKIFSFGSKNLENFFFTLLTEYSGGIPRVVQYVALTFNLIKQAIDEIQIKNEEEIEIILEEIFNFIQKYTLDFKKCEKETDPEIRLATMLLYISSTLNFSFNVEEILPGTKHQLKDILPCIPFCITTEENRCKIIHPKVKYFFLEESYKGNILYEFMNKLHSQYRQTLDIAEVFEFFTVSLFAFYKKMMKGTLYKEFFGNIFDKTSLKDCLIHEYDKIYCLPKVTTRIEINETEKPKSDAQPAPLNAENILETISSLKKITVEQLNETLPLFPDRSLIVVRKKSRSCVFYDVPSKDIDVGFQLKSGAAEFKLSDITDEIMKYGTLSGKRKHILIICAMKLDSELNDFFDPKNQTIVFSEGIYKTKVKKSGSQILLQLNKNETPTSLILSGDVRKKVIKAKRYETFSYHEASYCIPKLSPEETELYQHVKEGQWISCFTVPPNCEIVIMGEMSLKGFFGDTNLQEFRKLVLEQLDRKNWQKRFKI